MVLRGDDEGVCFLDPAADLRALAQQGCAPAGRGNHGAVCATHNWQERFAAARLIDRLFPCAAAEMRAGSVLRRPGRLAA